MAEQFNAYIDGFNLYMGCLSKRNDLKWLDLISLAQNLMPEFELNNVYYFTASLKSRFVGDKSNERQHAYLRVLEYSGVTIVRGKFIKKVTWSRVDSKNRRHFSEPTLPSRLGLTQSALNSIYREASPDLPMVKSIKFEEKGSDVNLASILLRDSHLFGLKNALIVSGDSDLSLPIKLVGQFGTSTHVYVPGRRKNIHELHMASTHINWLEDSALGNNQFPDRYIAPSGKIINKPKSWVGNQN
jgi:uncharacterized LabA/DUF88 family protein